MNLVFLSDKVCWPEPASPTGYATLGGFPFQMEMLSRLFNQTRIIIMERKQPAPQNLMFLMGFNLSVHPLKEPPGEGWTRKISILPWLIINGGRLWREIREADILHINVPGDLGGIAVLLGLLQRKRMFIRHCGTWDQPATFANRALLWLLERIADNKMNVVMATGWNEQSPSPRNRNIHWIFSTTLHDEELRSLPEAEPWQPGNTLKLITVGRLTALKNMQSIIEAMPQVMRIYPDVTLRIVGDGPYASTLQLLVREKKLENRIEFTGNLDHAQVLQLLSESHIFVFPTRVSEGFPKALLEALACGLPIIATQVSVIPYLLKNGCGYLLQDSTPSSVAQAVLQMTSSSSSLARRAEFARQTARGYTLEAWASEIQMRLEQAWGSLRSSGGE